MLNLKKGNIILSEDHILINFLEEKKNDIRQVVLIDDQAIEVLMEYYTNTTTDYLFNLKVNVFNNNLKKLAKLAKITEEVECVKNYRTRTISHKKPKWELISSHTIRRFAVNQNVAKYGIDVARQFSGHKDYVTIKKNYMRNMNQNELLARLKESNKPASPNPN